MADLGLSGEMAGPEHRYRLRIYYEDTDTGGIVYHADYLKFAERARTEMLRLIGATHSDIIENDGVMFIVRKADVDYRAAARLDDVVEVRSRMLAFKGATVSARQTIYKVEDGAVDPDRGHLVDIDLLLACVSEESGRPARVPATLTNAIAALNAVSN